MTLNSISPAYIELHYTSGGHPHTALWCVSLGAGFTPGVEPELVCKVGSPVAAGTKITELITLLQPFFHTTDTFNNYFVFSKPLPADPPVFIWSGTIGVAGSASAADTPCGEAVFSFKTPNAGGLKLYLMETIYANNLKDALPATTGTPERALTDYMTGGNAFVIARNNSFPLIPLFLTTKLNDHLRRKYLL